MPGPLPKAADQRRRRNAPTIPTTKLPASGRAGAPPESPYELAEAGAAWWDWAWHTPQAAAWSAGDLYVIARRASFEDYLAALHDIEGLDLCDLLEAENAKAFRFVVQRIAAMATNKLQITKEMREIDDRLGLTPKGFAALRWEVAPDELGAKRGAAAKPKKPRLVAVDPAAS